MAVTALAADDAWAVGEAAHGAALIEHWDGTSWTRVDAPSFGSQTVLLSVSAISPTDIWAAGTSPSHHGFADPVVLRWDGQSWTQVPFETTYSTHLNGIAALSDKNVWVDGGLSANSLVYHWNGSQWENTKVRRGYGSNGLSDIDAASRGDIWVVGSRQPSGDGSLPVAQSWQGDHWLRVRPAIPPHGQYTGFADVDTVGPSLAWAVGDSHDGSGQYPLVEGWDGTAWSVFPIQGATFDSSFDAVEASSASDAWAVGSADISGDAYLAHWDGVQWQQVPPPQVDGHPLHGYLHGVAARTSDDAWAVGWDPTGAGVFPTIVHWDGSAWTVMAP